MTNEFAAWLAQNGLTEAFTTNAGDSFYVNKNKGFGVIRKAGEYGVTSFYLSDIIGFKTYDDEHLVVDWSRMGTWRILERSTRFSTNEVYMKIQLQNQSPIKLQLFRGVNGNIARNTQMHIDLLNYACQISKIVYDCAVGA